jgi:hypothetical protein
MNKKTVLILLLFVAGFLFRIGIVMQWKTELIWDALYYSATANAILSGVHTANCCNITAGYPMIIAFIYRIFGIDNVIAVKIFQSFIDTCTALCVYILAKRLTPRAAIPTYVLYLCNPLTASYAAAVLTETTSLFLIALIAVCVTTPRFEKRKMYWFLFGLLLGYLTFTKSALYYFSLGGIVCFTFLLFHGTKRFHFFLVSMLGFFIVSLYSLVTNYQTFHIFSVVPPYRTIYGSLYTSFFMDRTGEKEGDVVKLHPEYVEFIQTYFYEYNHDPSALPELDHVYKLKFNEKFKNEWPVFIHHWIRNIFWTWDKNHLGVYSDPWNPIDIIPVRIGNSILLITHVIGFILYSIKKRTLNNPIQVYTGLLFLFIIVTFCMINNETRLSLPYYPLVFVWAGYAVSFLHMRFLWHTHIGGSDTTINSQS